MHWYINVSLIYRCINLLMHRSMNQCTDQWHRCIDWMYWSMYTCINQLIHRYKSMHRYHWSMYWYIYQCINWLMHQSLNQCANQRHWHIDWMYWLTYTHRSMHIDTLMHQCITIIIDIWRQLTQIYLPLCSYSKKSSYSLYLICCKIFLHLWKLGWSLGVSRRYCVLLLIRYYR